MKTKRIIKVHFTKHFEIDFRNKTGKILNGTTIRIGWIIIDIIK